MVPIAWERQQHDRKPSYVSTAYLDNLERVVPARYFLPMLPDARRRPRSQVSDLEARVRDATDKLGRIRRLLISTPDTALRPEIAKINRRTVISGVLKLTQPVRPETQ
jgi:hypothetical protein